MKRDHDHPPPLLCHPLLSRIGQLWSSRKNSYELVRSPNSKITNQRIIDLWKFHFIIVSAHPYCARKSTCHVIHLARALSTKLNNDRADGHCYSFDWIWRSWTFGDPYFFFRNRFNLQLSPHCPKMKKKSMWEVKKISRFLPTGHGILPFCGCKARETMVAKCELVLWGTSPVD